MAPSLTEVSNCSLLLIYRPRRDERLSWPGWLTQSGRFTHISGHPSATGRAQDRESTPAEDRRSTTEPRNQPLACVCVCLHILVGKATTGNPNISSIFAKVGRLASEVIVPVLVYALEVCNLDKSLQIHLISR